jgi:hypothetical protein
MVTEILRWKILRRIVVIMGQCFRKVLTRPAGRILQLLDNSRRMKLIRKVGRMQAIILTVLALWMRLRESSRRKLLVRNTVVAQILIIAARRMLTTGAVEAGCRVTVTRHLRSICANLVAIGSSLRLVERHSGRKLSRKKRLLSIEH